MYHRKKWNGIEIDIIFYHEKFGLVVMEVKSNRAGWSVHERLNHVQIFRLYRVYLSLLANLDCVVDVRVLLVGRTWEEHRLTDLINI